MLTMQQGRSGHEILVPLAGTEICHHPNDEVLLTPAKPPSRLHQEWSRAREGTHEPDRVGTLARRARCCITSALHPRAGVQRNFLAVTTQLPDIRFPRRIATISGPPREDRIGSNQDCVQ